MSINHPAYEKIDLEIKEGGTHRRAKKIAGVKKTHEDVLLNAQRRNLEVRDQELAKKIREELQGGNISSEQNSDPAYEEIDSVSPDIEANEEDKESAGLRKDPLEAYTDAYENLGPRDPKLKLNLIDKIRDLLKGRKYVEKPKKIMTLEEKNEILGDIIDEMHRNILEMANRDGERIKLITEDLLKVGKFYIAGRDFIDENELRLLLNDKLETLHPDYYTKLQTSKSGVVMTEKDREDLRKD